MDKKELTKVITKSLFALYVLIHFGWFHILAFIFAWPVLISTAIDIIQYLKKAHRGQRPVKMSATELGLQKEIEKYLQTHESITVNENISLKMTKDSRDFYDRLGVFFFGEYVCQLPDFRSYDMETYNTILADLKLEEAPQPEAKAEELTAETFIEKINEYNTEIQHEEISNYLYMTSSLLTNISTLETKGMSDSKKTRKLYMYYLPILMDILDNYCKMKDNMYVAEDIKAMEEKLIKTIILCNEALKTLLASLNEVDILNMSVNMNTLENILKKDGLIKGAGMEKVKESVK
ncbi:MAG: hypothetical protein VB012_03130 [Erysipelotrichaceae bacterium]|nr:hypothetical protein [Erysipelotrichaceae bacterium]